MRFLKKRSGKVSSGMRLHGVIVNENDLPGCSVAEALRRKQFEKSLSVSQKLFIVAKSAKRPVYVARTKCAEGWRRRECSANKQFAPSWMSGRMSRATSLFV